MVYTLAEMRKISRCIVSIDVRLRISINFILFLSLYCTSFLSRFSMTFIATRRAVSGRLKLHYPNDGPLLLVGKAVCIVS